MPYQVVQTGLPCGIETHQFECARLEPLHAGQNERGGKAFRRMHQPMDRDVRCRMNAARRLGLNQPGGAHLFVQRDR